MSTTPERYAGIAAGVQRASEIELEKQRRKIGQLMLDLQARCAERLIDYTITGIAGGRVRVALHGVDWAVGVRATGADVAEAIDNALDELNRCQ